MGRADELAREPDATVIAEIVKVADVADERDAEAWSYMRPDADADELLEVRVNPRSEMVALTPCDLYGVPL
jgi:hypothetical protein